MTGTDGSASQARLALLEALVAAQERFPEVVAAVEAATDDEDASGRVSALLGLSDPHLAQAVLDLQLRRRTVGDRDRIRSERDQLRQQLGPS